MRQRVLAQPAIFRNGIEFLIEPLDTIADLDRAERSAQEQQLSHFGMAFEVWDDDIGTPAEQRVKHLLRLSTVAKSLWCPRPESNRYAPFQESGGF